MSNVGWETLNRTQILEKIEEEETSDSNPKLFLTPLHSPGEPICRNAEYDRRCIEKYSRQRSTQYLPIYDKIVSQLLDPMRGWRKLHTKPPKIELKEDEVHHSLELQIGASSTTLGVKEENQDLGSPSLFKVFI